MMLKSLVLLLLAGVYPFSAPAADERCMKIPLMEKYDPEKLLGPWYAQEIGDNDDSAKKCLYYNILPGKSSGHFMVERTYLKDKSGKKVEPFRLDQVGNTSELRVQWKGQTRAVWTTGSDYKTWSNWYICQPEQDDKGILFILTKERTPSKATMETALNSAGKVGFQLTRPYLKSVDQSNCE